MQLKIKCLQLDLARQKETPAFIRSFMDFAVASGYDTLMIYFETAIRTAETADFPPEETYSAEEVREILAYAKKVGLSVIPSLQNLSYLTDIMKSARYEKYAERPGRFGERSNTGCLGEPAFTAFIDRYITETVSLFDGEFVNIGLDEQFDLGIDPRCRDAIAGAGSKDRLFLAHIRRTHDLLASLGKRMMMWDDWFEYEDILEEVPRDIVMLNWNYVYFSTLPAGHWTGRTMRDPFGEYDRLGFDYMFAFYAQRASSYQNLESFTAYAEKYTPLGAITTTWDSSDCFYEGAYPVIRVAPALWDGKIASRVDAEACCADILGGDRALARLLLLSDVTEVGMNGDPAQINFAPSFAERLYDSHLTLICDEVQKRLDGKKGQAKVIAEQISLYLREQAAKMRVNRLSDRIFDRYENAPITMEKLLGELEDIREEFCALRKAAEAHWEEVRPGIVSRGGALKAKFDWYLGTLDRTEKALREEKPTAVLSLTQAVPELYNTVRVSLTAHFADGGVLPIHEGGIKPPEALLEIGGSFTVRFALPKKELRALTVSSFGEGALYLENAAFRCEKETRYLRTVLSADADIEHPENAAKPDASFAKLGCEDGHAHFGDFSLSQTRHSITLGF